MSTQSLDDVLADVDASDQELTNETAGNEVEVSQETEAEGQDDGEGDQGHDAHGALHAERQRVRRKYTDTVADFERKLGEATTGFDKKFADGLAANDAKWEQRFNQFAQRFQQPEPARREPEVQPEPIDPYADPEKFRDAGIKQHLDPVTQRIAKISENISRKWAIKEHGEEKVQAAFSALDTAARNGNQEALATAKRIKFESDDPFGDLMDWHQKTSIVSEVGNDPEAFIAKRLSDPAFLAKHGLTKAAAKAVAQEQANAGGTLPSLNRTTAAADDDDGDEEEDAGVVFNTALRRGVRR